MHGVACLAADCAHRAAWHPLCYSHSTSSAVNTPEKRILIVDNEPELTDVLKLALESLGGFGVLTENDPAFAVASAQAFLPDLIILDIKMPGLDGADVAILLKDEPALSDTPIVFLTGTVTVPETGLNGPHSGGLRFLPKTMRLDAMVACLNDILREGELPIELLAAEDRAA